MTSNSHDERNEQGLSKIDFHSQKRIKIDEHNKYKTENVNIQCLMEKEIINLKEEIKNLKGNLIKNEDEKEKEEKRKNKKKKDIEFQLNKLIGPEFLSHRSGFGNMRLTYVEGWVVINIANKIFGFDGWNSEVKDLKIDFIDEKNGLINAGCSCLTRVTLKDGTYKEDVGLGRSENSKSKGMAIEKSKKEALTDSLKRCFRQFGNVLGNCLYDKGFLRYIMSIKADKRRIFKDTAIFKAKDLFDEDPSSNKNKIKEDCILNSNITATNSINPTNLKESIKTVIITPKKPTNLKESVKTVIITPKKPTNLKELVKTVIITPKKPTNLKESVKTVIITPKKDLNNGKDLSNKDENSDSTDFFDILTFKN